jgi:pyruvate kinase
MAKICREAEASIDYYSLFKAIMKRTPLPMTPLESLASSAVRPPHHPPHARLLSAPARQPSPTPVVPCQVHSTRRSV